MKDFLIKLLKKKLRLLARLIIWRYRPGIIGVTGSVGKTSTKIAITTVLGSERIVRCSPGNFNNELGLPLTIISSSTKIDGLFFWPKVIFKAIWQIIAPLGLLREKYPEILVLEYGADRPGDIKYLLSIARPNMSIITAVGEIPVHVEFYSGPEELAREKCRLIEFLPAAGFAILNSDDEAVYNLKDRTRAHLMTFGYGRGADIRITGFETQSEGDRPIGISFKIEYGGSFVPVRLSGVFGRAQGYAAGAAACIGLVFGMNLVKISEALKNYKPPTGRMELLPGVKYTNIIDDSYNASPLSTHAALDTLLDLPAKRKIAVLGDMTEIGRYAPEAHEEIGRIASNVVDFLITVGPRAKFIAEGARENGMKNKNILSFDSAEDARKPIQDLIKKGDLVLIKASHIMRLDKIVEEIKAY
jgi:UDP-N-acetylmuramoyl-tripeptide--D-alanyl-D-alanine ligase